MAAPVVRRVGRHSHTIQPLAEGPPLPLEQSMEAAREAVLVRNDLSTRQLGREPDTITTAVVSLEYDREGRPGLWEVLTIKLRGIKPGQILIHKNDHRRGLVLKIRPLVTVAVASQILKR